MTEFFLGGILTFALHLWSPFTFIRIVKNSFCVHIKEGRLVMIKKSSFFSSVESCSFCLMIQEFV